MDKKEFKALKKAYKKARRKATALWKWLSILSAPLAVIFCILLVIFNMFDNTVALFVGGTFWELENEDPNYTYYEGDFKTEADRTAAGAALVKQVIEHPGKFLPRLDIEVGIAPAAEPTVFIQCTQQNLIHSVARFAVVRLNHIMHGMAAHPVFRAPGVNAIKLGNKAVFCKKSIGFGVDGFFVAAVENILAVFNAPGKSSV